MNQLSYFHQNRPLFMPCLPCNPTLLLTESSSSFYHICTHSVRSQPTFFSLSISLETRRENKLTVGSSVCVCACAHVCVLVSVFVFLCSINLPPRGWSDARQTAGLSRCFHPCLSPLEHVANHFSGQPWPNSAPDTAQDSLVTPRINELEICQPAGAAGERGQDRKRRRRRRMTWEG